MTTPMKYVGADDGDDDGVDDGGGDSDDEDTDVDDGVGGDDYVHSSFFTFTDVAHLNNELHACATAS